MREESPSWDQAFDVLDTDKNGVVEPSEVVSEV